MSQEELGQYIYAYGRELFSFCCSVTRNRQEAEDLYQDTFLKLYEIRENLQIETNPKSYLMGISVNLYRNYRRKLSIRKRIAGTKWPVEEPEGDIPADSRLPAPGILRADLTNRKNLYIIMLFSGESVNPDNGFTLFRLDERF